jgi:hypothetical protein
MNLNRILQCLKYIKLNTPFTNYNDFLRPNSQREIMLFCAQLFLQLPSYTAKKPIVFEGLLEEKITKNILLTNKTNFAT